MASEISIELINYGIARDIIGTGRLAIRMDGRHLYDLRKYLESQYPLIKDLHSLSFAVGESYRSDDYVLMDGEEVVLIPPVSGG